MRSLFLIFSLAVCGHAESITGSKIIPGGVSASIGSVAVDGYQSFGSNNISFRSVVYPGAHTLVSNAPIGYVVSYSVCVNCTTHLVGSYTLGTLAKVVVPINGSVDVSWLYAPNPGVLQGARVFPDGSPFLNATLTIDSVQLVSANTSTFTSNVSAGTHTISSNAPPGYSVSYSVCSNCLQHVASSYRAGASVSVAVSPGGSADVSFLYTAVGNSAITLNAPVANQTVAGNFTFSLTGGDLAKAASVEYSIGSNRIARVPAQISNPTFQTIWNSALASDGESQIETTVRDYLDNIIFQDVRPVVLSNYGNAASAPLPATLTGSVPVTLSAFDRLHFPAYWQIFLDGEIGPNSSGLLFSDQDGVHQNARSTVLDTTAYPNGRHEFHFAFHSNDYPAISNGPSPDFRGMATQNVNINNNRAFMEILPNYLFVYTSVSTGVQLTCTRVYTNQDRDSCAAPSYTLNPATSSPGIQVSAAGLVFGGQEGYADITVADAGKSATVHVWVRRLPGLPHFQDLGSYGTIYTPGKSIFATAQFQLSPDALQADPVLYADVKRAGVNTLNRGIYLPNSNLSLPFSSWKASFDSSAYSSSWSWSLANGFRVLGSGDDIVRRPGWEGSWAAHWPAAAAAVTYAMQTFAQSGAGLALDVVDESSAIWGSDPAPIGLIGTANAIQSATCLGSSCVSTWPALSDPTQYALLNFMVPNNSFLLGGQSALSNSTQAADVITAVSGTQVSFNSSTSFPTQQTFTSSSDPTLDFLWFSGRTSCTGNVMCNPALPNNILPSVASWLRGATATVPISWPPAGAAQPAVQRNWFGKGSVSDYASHYWDSNQQRRTYPYGMSVRENQNSMLTAFLARQSSVDITRPQLLEQTMAGIDYLKYSGAGNAVYSPPLDQLVHVGVVPKAVASGIMTATAAGTAGVKIYKYDNTYPQRRDNTGNGSEFESDGGPSTGEILNWQSMGYASATLIKSLQEFVLGAPMSSPYLGRNIISGARNGANGNLLIVVNGWDAPRTVQVDVSRYRTGNSILRYRVADTSIKLQAMADLVADTVTLAAGETALYLFPKTAVVPNVDTVTFTPDAAGTTTVLRTNYLYSQNTAIYGDPIDCSAGCTVKIDRKLGDAFYSYAVLDLTGAVQCRSSAIILPAGTSVALPVNAQTRGAVCQ